MNCKYLSIFAAVALSGLATGFSEDSPTPSATPGQNKGGEGKRMMRDKFLESLPPEIRERFQAARTKAMEDPKIKDLKAAAEKSNMELFKAVRDKMIEIDPGLAELIKKRDEAKPGKNGPEEKKNPSEAAAPPSPPAPISTPPPAPATDPAPQATAPKPVKKQQIPEKISPGLASLTGEEREKLLEVRAKAKSDPTVVEAEKAMDATSSPADHKVAMEAYRAAMQAALLKADPSIEPILKKMAAEKAQPKPPASPAKDGAAPATKAGEGEMNQMAK